MAAEVGYHEAAMEYFHKALYVDLADLHGNSVDGLHIASCGGVWSALVFGFGGMRDHGGVLSFDPRLPVGWPSLSFRVRWRGTRMRVTLTQDRLGVQVEELGTEPHVTVWVRGAEHDVSVDHPVEVALDDQGPRVDGTLGDTPMVDGRRSDGTWITAGVPDPTLPAAERESTLDVHGPGSVTPGHQQPRVGPHTA